MLSTLVATTLGLTRCRPSRTPAIAAARADDPDEARNTSAGRTPRTLAMAARAASNSMPARLPRVCRRAGSAQPCSIADSHASRAAGIKG